MSDTRDRGFDVHAGRPALLVEAIRGEIRQSDGLFVYGVLLVLTLVGYLFASIELTHDRFIPFKSATFVLGACVVFYTGLFHSVRKALKLVVGLLVLMILVRSLDAEEGGARRLAVEVPLVALFMVGLAVIPSLVPWMLEEETGDLVVRNAQMDEKLHELRQNIKALQEKDVESRATTERQHLAAVTSRLAALNAYGRELQQAGSVREILNLLFHNFVKLLGAQELVQFIVAEGDGEGIVSRVSHKEADRLENSRHPLDQGLLNLVMKDGKPFRSESPADVGGGFEAYAVLPLRIEDRIHALYAIGALKEGAPTAADFDVAKVMVAMAEGATEQLRIAMPTL